MSKTKRLSPEVRQDQILTAALSLSEKDNYTRITREQVAIRAGCAPGLISRYFGEMASFRKEIMQRENLAVLIQGLVCKDPVARRAPKTLRQKAAQFFSV